MGKRGIGERIHALLFLLIMITSCVVSGHESNRSDNVSIRVAFFPLKNLYNKENNQRSGYAHDLMQRLAQEEGFTLEWVDLPLRSAVSALVDNQVDLVMNAYRTPRNTAYITYSQQQLFNVPGLLLANRTNNDVYYHDLAYFKGKKVAVFDMGRLNTYLREFLQEHNIEMQLVGYTTYAQMLEALKAGDVSFIAVSEKPKR